MAKEKYCSTSCPYLVVKGDDVFCSKYEYLAIDREEINFSQATLCFENEGFSSLEETEEK